MHVDTDLSAYLDRELSPAGRARVDTHLGTCRRCSARLAELRATASLVSALEGPLPSRSLVPRASRGDPHMVERWQWLRPVRSLSTVASGAFLFLFLITAVAQSGSNLGGGPTSPFTRTTGAAPAAAPAPAGEQAPAVRALSPSPEGFKAAGPTAQPAPAADLAQRSGATAVPTPPSIPGAAGASVSGAPERVDLASPAAQTSGEAELAYGDAQRRAFGQSAPPSPLLWLALALLMATAAVIAHWRLRTA